MFDRAINFLTGFNRNLWALSFGWLVGAMGFAASMPFIAIYFHSEFGMTMTQIGVFFGVMALVRSAFQLVGGEVSDRMSRQKLLIHSQLWRGVSFLLLSAAIYGDYGFAAVAGSLFIATIFGSIFHPVANAMVSDILPENKRLDGYAITRAAGNFGWALGPAIGGFLATSSYALLFLISAVITIASAIVFALFMRAPSERSEIEAFKISDIIAVKDDHLLAKHSILIFLLYLVVSQLLFRFRSIRSKSWGFQKHSWAISTP